MAFLNHQCCLILRKSHFIVFFLLFLPNQENTQNCDQNALTRITSSVATKHALVRVPLSLLQAKILYSCTLVYHHYRDETKLYILNKYLGNNDDSWVVRQLFMEC